jgi:hypothetical protein
MSSKRVKQYKRVIGKELVKAQNDIVFNFIKETKDRPLRERIIIALWIIKGK